MRTIKKIEDLTIADNYMFAYIMSKENLCKGLLERLLHIQIEKIEYIDAEKTYLGNYGGKGIRMDVYVKDDKRIFDIEMQSGHFENLEKRTRYYQSVIDATTVRSGQSYSVLKESYVIFICTGDPFGYGLPVYTVKQVFSENGKVYDDKAHKMFYNVSAFASADDAEIRGFLEYVGTGNAETDYAREIMYEVNKAKMMDPDFFSYYYSMFAHDTDIREEGREEGRLVGFQQGAHNARVETARAFLALGVNTKEQIAQATGLSLAEVEQLQNDTAK